MTPGSTGAAQSAGGSTVTPRAAFWRALCLWVLTVAAAGGALIYNHVHPLPPKLGGQGNVVTGTVVVVFIVAFATVGALLAWKRPANPIGWLLSATGLSYASAVAVGRLLLQFPRTQAWGNWLGWMYFAGIGFVVFVLLLFPTGSLPSRRWRPVAWAAAAAIAAWVLGNAFAPTLASGPPPVRNPIGVAGPAGHVFDVLGGAGAALIAATGLAAIVSLIFRYRRAGAVEREQLKWLVYAGGLIVAAVLAEPMIEQLLLGPGDAASTLQGATSSGAAALIPVAIGIAVFRYHLYDIDLVISKTLVYGSLAVFITAVYVAIVVGIGSLAQHGARPSLGLSIAATAVVAVAFQPVRARVQRLANRLVYGQRATPYEVLADFAGRMAGIYAVEDLLPRMARILAEGTGAARADVWLRSGDTFHDGAVWPPGASPQPPARATQAGVPPYPADRILPVRHQGEVLAAQDEERRRIERNIHDGAQQQLVALAIKLSITESMIGTDTDGERELLAELRQDAAGAVEDLRDLARGIYPPLLASVGLVAALEAQASKAPAPASVTADGVGRYPQELEAAVYFCVLEALQNVAKYARATRAEVRLAASGHDLEFEVTDDGAGFDPASKAHGTGLQGMADRLHAHGGSLDVRSSPGAGTTILGRLPCRVLEAAG